MTWLSPARRSVVHPQHLLRQWGAVSPCAKALCRPRCSSTFCPVNIAELLRPSPHAASPRRTPSDGEQLTVKRLHTYCAEAETHCVCCHRRWLDLANSAAVLTPQLAEALSTGAAVTVTGTWTPSQGQEQSHELQVSNVQVLGENDATTYPVQKKYQTPEFLRTVPHLRTRLPFNSLILRLRSLVTAQVTNYFAKHDFVQCHPPIITSSDCEGAGEVFTVAPEASSTPDRNSPNQVKQHEDLFFGSSKYLTVSSQLHLEALAQSVNRVWALSPTFRAEKSDTARHLSEFYMLEAELAFVNDVGVVMDVVEDMLRSVATELRSSVLGQELLEARAREQGQEGTSVSHTVLAQRWQGLVAGPWPRITYDTAVQHLKEAVAQGKANFEYAPGHEDGLQTEHERFLAESLGRGGPVFVTDYPRNIKPFYMAPSTDTAAEGQAASNRCMFRLARTRNL